MAAAFIDGGYYWVRVPRSVGTDGNRREWMSEWQPARFTVCPPDMDAWTLIGDEQVAQSSSDFIHVIVHPAPMRPPDA